jgi:hypothetical protein
MDPNFGRLDTGTTTEERRGEPRRRVFRGAQVRFNKGYGAYECVVRNESGNGARLNFGDTSAVPTSFELVLNGERAGRMAHVRWRRATEIGVEFEPRAALAA